jgi:hypothetical protein
MEIMPTEHPGLFMSFVVKLKMETVPAALSTALPIPQRSKSR